MRRATKRGSFARLEHRREVVDGGVGVAPPRIDLMKAEAKS